MKKTYTIFLLLLLLMLHLNAMAQKAKAITINEVPAMVQEAFATESMSSVQKWAGTVCCFLYRSKF